MKKAELVPPECRLQIIGEIDSDAYERFSEQLYILECQSPRPKVVIELNSHGGEAVIALAFAARMRLSRCHLTVVVYGEASSAAVLILAQGNDRLMTKEAWCMVHEDSGKISGNVVEMERESLQYRRLENQWAELLEANTGTKASVWTKLHKDTTYLTPQECLELGLITRII